MSDLYGPAPREQCIATIQGALDVELTTEHLQRIQTAVPEGSVAGQRYDAMGMSILDSKS